MTGAVARTGALCQPNKLLEQAGYNGRVNADKSVAFAVKVNPHLLRHADHFRNLFVYVIASDVWFQQFISVVHVCIEVRFQCCKCGV